MALKQWKRLNLFRPETIFSVFPGVFIDNKIMFK